MIKRYPKLFSKLELKGNKGVSEAVEGAIVARKKC